VSRSTDLFDDLIRFATRLYNTLTERMRRTLGLTMGQFEMLRIIDRIEDAGWCRRKPNPDDRRSSLLSRVEGVLSASAVKGLGTTLFTLRRAIEADGVGLPRG
jgi:hypothetical protein